jgi:putative GTP pyrophosphokinase
MSPAQRVSARDRAQIDRLVNHYISSKSSFEYLTDSLERLVRMPPVGDLVHSLRKRVKDPEHLRAKLVRKLLLAKSEGKAFGITEKNLFQRITDLAGIRILHLHTGQFTAINNGLLQLLSDQQYTVVEGPFAWVWDNEYAALFRGAGVEERDSERMYTSVHYVVETNPKARLRGEIQVRTLAEELWGEVDHSINYPDPSTILACREQVKALARATSSCTRLVDSIFASYSGQSLWPTATIRRAKRAAKPKRSRRQPSG